MISLFDKQHPSQTDKLERFNQKMLALAQELLTAEIMADTIIACGQELTSKITGQYGRYETCHGQVVTYQPHFNLNFTLISADFVVTTHLVMLKTIIQRVEGDYELAVNM